MINLNLVKAIWLSGFRAGQEIGHKQGASNYGYVSEKDIWEKEVESKLDEININFEKDWENIP